MKFGVTIFPTDYAMNIVDLGRALEERGFESLFIPEHTHIPSSRESPWPGGPELPEEYRHTLDPFVALGAVAAATKTLMLGTGICLVTEHDPIVLAKEIASLDLLSGGRFLFGIGAGWNFEEMRNHGSDPAHRWGIVRERIRAMQRIWTQDEAEFHGKYVNFDPIWSWPKPAQQPHPPILIGGNSAGTFKRVLDYGDEWLPIMGRGAPIEEQIAELQRQAKERGRGPIPITVFGVRPDAEMIERLAAAGVTRCLFGLPPAGEEKILPLLDRFAGVMLSRA
ncbi:MAG TPA: LLM class F420-dependent oxidoreductase [Dehalococcoidia bacterium]|nr:LLM class F420-dependent oxidoreductase [Dehalococcoidia bacterium]